MDIEPDDETTAKRRQDVRMGALKRDDWCCRGCGSRMFLEVWYVKPLNQGGVLEVSNAIILDRDCFNKVQRLYKEGKVFPSNCIVFVDFGKALRGE